MFETILSILLVPALFAVAHYGQVASGKWTQHTSALKGWETRRGRDN